MWLERTRWMDHLLGCNLNIMAKLVESPEGKDESVLRLICASLDRLLEAARKSIIDREINHFESKQINSFLRHKTFPKPLNIQMTHNTFQRYKMIWQRLLCYVIRTSDPDSPNRPLYELTHVQLMSLKGLPTGNRRIIGQDLGM